MSKYWEKKELREERTAKYSLHYARVHLNLLPNKTAINIYEIRDIFPKTLLSNFC